MSQNVTPTPRRHTLADYIHELANTHHHTEHFTVREGAEWKGRDHHVTVPSLVVQLGGSDIPSTAVEEGARAGYASKPAARLEALDTLAHIDRSAAAWVRHLGEDDSHRDTASTLHQLHGLAASADPETRKAIAHDAKRWWVRARIVTGWDSAPWTPDNTCPICSERGTLRIRLADGLASCTGEECGSVWEPQTIGLLAEHIEAESNAERAPAQGPGACWCPVPEPKVPNLSRLCPGCGSARCRHAVGARLLDAIKADRVT